MWTLLETWVPSPCGPSFHMPDLVAGPQGLTPLEEAGSQGLCGSLHSLRGLLPFLLCLLGNSTSANSISIVEILIHWH